MNSQATDLQPLIQAAKRNEPEAVNRLLEMYRQYLRLLARSSIGKAIQRRADPSDLVQQTMLNAYANFAQFRGQSEVELVAWLRRIMANNIAQLVRHYKTEGRQISRDRSLEDMLTQSSQAMGDMVAASATSPSMAAARREMGVVLADALQELGELQREVVVLRNIEQLSWEQVAQRMDRTSGAVRMLWVRALEQLRPLIEARL